MQATTFVKRLDASRQFCISPRSELSEMSDCNSSSSGFQAIDVFASFSTSTANRLTIMREISRLWGVVGPETLYPVNKPVIQVLLLLM